MLYPDALADALALVFNFETFLWMFIGAVIGIAMGAIPGLTAPTAIALALPLTFQMQVAPALGLLIGLYKGAIYGGSIAAITFAIPGTPAAAATVYDGFKLSQKGKGRKALLMALYASVTSDLLSTLLVIAVAPFLIAVALQFGPSERFWLMVLAIMLIGGLSGRHIAKGLFSAALGMFLATIGTDPITGAFRNTFGVSWLQDGIGLIPLVVGIFAIGTMLEDVVRLLRRTGGVDRVDTQLKRLFSLKLGEGLTLREYFSTWKEMLIGTAIGSFVGMLPGLGAAVGAFLSFSVAKQVSPQKEIGSGVLEGIAAAESGNSSTVGPALLPLLAFGIPGSATVALIGGALMLQGLTPSARMFSTFPEVIYALFIILLLVNLFILGIGRGFAIVFAKIGQLSQSLLIPAIFVLSVIGTYVIEQNPAHVLLMFVLGLVGFGMRLVGVPEAPLIITFLITPLMEANLRQALLINRGDWIAALFHSPLAIGLFLAAFVMLILSAWIQRKVKQPPTTATPKATESPQA